MISTDNHNLKYCLLFLRNSGERLAAIRLCHDATGMAVDDAMRFVDGLKMEKPSCGNIKLVKVTR